MRAWFGLADGRDPDPLSLLLAVDALPPTAFELGLSGWVPTVELTVHVRSRPAPGPLRVSITTRNLAGGFLEEDAEVWDSADRLVAQSRQLARVRLSAERPPAQPGRQPLVGVGSFGGRRRRFEGHVVPALLVGQYPMGDRERELGQFRVESERPAEGLGEVPGVGDGLHHVSRQGDTARRLAPGDVHQRVQPGVVRPALLDLRPDLVVRRHPAVVRHAVHKRPHGETVAARADHGDPRVPPAMCDSSVRTSNSLHGVGPASCSGRTVLISAAICSAARAYRGRGSVFITDLFRGSGCCCAPRFDA